MVRTSVCVLVGEKQYNETRRRTGPAEQFEGGSFPRSWSSYTRERKKEDGNKDDKVSTNELVDKRVGGQAKGRKRTLLIRFKAIVASEKR